MRGVAGIVLAFLIFSTSINVGAEDHTSNKTNLIFPLAGESFIVWGGRTKENNKNHFSGTSSEKFALDIVGLKKKTSPISQRDIEKFKTNGLTIAYEGLVDKNESHFCFGRDVVAPASGKIASIGRGVADNIPGILNNQEPRGNFVMIDHGNNEVSLLLHLKNQSIPLYLKKGMKIEQGIKIGECGNSGRSRGPHLHYQLQNSTTFSISSGIPVEFSNIVVNSEFKVRAELVQGQIVSGPTVGILGTLL